MALISNVGLLMVNSIAPLTNNNFSGILFAKNISIFAGHDPGKKRHRS